MIHFSAIGDSVPWTCFRGWKFDGLGIKGRLHYYSHQWRPRLVRESPRLETDAKIPPKKGIGETNCHLHLDQQGVRPSSFQSLPPSMESARPGANANTSSKRGVQSSIVISTDLPS